MQQASKGAFSEFSCNSTIRAEGGEAISRAAFYALVQRHVALHRPAPLSLEDLEAACRYAKCCSSSAGVNRSVHGS